MERVSVSSSNIHSIGFNRHSSTLEVAFKGKDGEISGVYWFHEVPDEVYDALMAAESKGKYFGQHIKGKYQCVKISGGEEKKS